VISLSSKNFKLITTGHSLGGACAQLFSYFWLKKNKSSKITCVTFGAPRVINGEIAKQFDKLLKAKRLFFQRIVTNGGSFFQTYHLKLLIHMKIEVITIWMKNIN